MLSPLALLTLLACCPVLSKAGPTPPVNAVEMKKTLQKSRSILHQNPNISPADRFDFDRHMLSIARELNKKRDQIFAAIFEKAKVRCLRQTGTPSTSKYSQGIFGDVDWDTISQTELKRITTTATDMGYTLSHGGGGSVTINELDGTFFHSTKEGYISRAAFQDPEIMTSFKLNPGELGRTKGYSIELSDNMKKLHATLDMDAETLFQSGKVQELAKSSMRIQTAMDRYKTPSQKKARPVAELFGDMDRFYAKPSNRNKTYTKLNFREKLSLIKAGITPETLGVIDGGAPSQTRQQQMQQFQDRCREVVTQGIQERLRAEKKVDQLLKKQHSRALKSGDFGTANTIHQEMLRNTALRNYADQGILGEGNRSLLAQAEGFTVKSYTNARTGKRIDTYLPTSGTEVPARFKRGALNGALNQKQFDAFIRNKQVKNLISVQKFGRQQSMRVPSKGTTSPKAGKKTGTFKLTKISLGSGLVDAYELYEAQKRSRAEIEQEITADTSNLELTGKTLKHLAKTFYYTTPVAGLVDVAESEYSKAAREYEQALTQGKNPSLTWALTTSTTKTVGQFSWGVVKSLTVKPKDDIIALANGSVETIAAYTDQFQAQVSAQEMADRVGAYKKQLYARKAELERNLRRFHAELPPADTTKPNITPTSIAGKAVSYLEEKMRKAEQDYRRELGQAGGVKTAAVAQSYKRMRTWVDILEESINDPDYGRLVAARERIRELIHGPDSRKTPPTTTPRDTKKNGTSPEDFAGEWTTNQGDMIIYVDGHNVTGTYDLDGGRIYGIIGGNMLQGKWVEADSDVTCSTKFKGSDHWGFFQFRMQGGNLYGGWQYCEPKKSGDKWNASRK